MEERKVFSLPELEFQPLGCPGCSQLLTIENVGLAFGFRMITNGFLEVTA
jgi:hypothetical protein